MRTGKRRGLQCAARITQKLYMGENKFKRKSIRNFEFYQQNFVMSREKNIALFKALEKLKHMMHKIHINSIMYEN